MKRILAGEVADRNLTVIISSHNLQELEDFATTSACYMRAELSSNRNWMT